MILLFLFYVLDVDESVPLNLSYAPFSWAPTVRSQEVDVSGEVSGAFGKLQGCDLNRVPLKSLRTAAQQAEWKVSFSLWQVVQDWKFAAQVLDRIFLWLFLITSVTGSVLIFTPALKMWLHSYHQEQESRAI